MIEVTVLGYSSEDDEWCVEDEFGHVFTISSGELTLDPKTDKGYI